MNGKKRWMVFALLFMLPSMLSAAQVAGVELPEKVQLGEQTLYLNGAGVRRKFIFKIYVAALYVPKRSHSPDDILGLKGPARVSMNFLYSEVGKKKLVDGWNEGFQVNNDEATMAAIGERLMRFNGMFETVRKGDEILLDYIPGKGTRVTIRGVEKGIVPGQDFYRALLRVWLGPKPVKESLKNALLGG